MLPCYRGSKEAQKLGQAKVTWKVRGQLGAVTGPHCLDQGDLRFRYR